MRDQDFDEILKGKLQEEDSQSPDWQSMQERLEQEDAFNQALDQRVAEATLLASDDSLPDWSSFQERQAALRERNRIIRNIKAIELLILMLSFSIYGVSTGFWDDLHKTVDQPVLMADASTSLLINRSVESVIPISSISQESDLTTSTHRGVLHPAYRAHLLASSESNTHPQDLLATDHQLAPLPPTTESKVVSSEIYEAPKVDYIVQVEPSQPKRSGWLLGAGFSRNADFIHTPTDAVYRGLSAYSSIEQGYTVDLSLRRRVGRLDINTGLAYTRQSYDPRPFSETNIVGKGQVETAQLTDISFDVVKVPLSLSYHYSHRGAVSAFVSAGLTTNWVVNTNYQVTQEQQSQNKRIVRAVDVTDGTEIGSEFQLSDKDFSQGLLSGGSLKNNFFLSAAIDTGAEIRVKDNTYIRLSAGYLHNLGIQIGPNQNRIHSLSMRLGVSRLL